MSSRAFVGAAIAILSPLAAQESALPALFQEAGQKYMAKSFSAMISMDGYTDCARSAVEEAKPTNFMNLHGHSSWKGFSVATVAFSARSDMEARRAGFSYFRGESGITIDGEGVTVEWHDHFVGQVLPLTPHQAVSHYGNTSLLALLLAGAAKYQVDSESVTAELVIDRHTLVRTRFSNRRETIGLLQEYVAVDQRSGEAACRMKVVEYANWRGVGLAMPHKVVFDQFTMAGRCRRSWFTITASEPVVDGQSVLDVAEKAHACHLRKEVMTSVSGSAHIAVDAAKWLRGTEITHEGAEGQAAPLGRGSLWPALGFDGMKARYSRALSQGYCGQLVLATAAALRGKAKEAEQIVADSRAVLDGDQFRLLALRHGLPVRVVDATAFVPTGRETCIITFRAAAGRHHATISVSTGAEPGSRYRCWSPPQDFSEMDYARIARNAVEQVMMVVD